MVISTLSNAEASYRPADARSSSPFAIARGDRVWDPAAAVPARLIRQSGVQ
jgi:hypothetical protein